MLLSLSVFIYTFSTKCYSYQIMLLNFMIQTMVEELRRLFDKYLEKIQDFKKESQCKELVPVCELNAVVSLCKLFDSLATPENGVRIV